jgi:hypothetical protein
MLVDPCIGQWVAVLTSLMGLFELPEDEEDPDAVIDVEEISGGAV